MAYQALARKWRPRRFAELVGQEHVVRALVHAIEQDRLHHAFLFTGTRGVGKTTLARILAKAINCPQRAGAEPCGECAVCREIDEGRFVDLLEVDAASKTKVEDTRELLENVIYAPTHGRYKIYLIDEVHMLSSHSFNALLKTLEEPPPHVKFLLATTDPQKIPVTVLSRCLQFNLKQLTADQIRGQIEFVLAKESIPYEANAVRALARAADGSLRDGLSLLDQAIAHGGGRVAGDMVQGMLGSVSRPPVIAMIEALTTLEAGALMEKIAELDQFAPNYAEVIQEMLCVLHHVSIAQWAPEVIHGEDDQELLLELARKTRAEDLQLFYQIALMGQRDLGLVRDPRMGFEMMMLRMLAFRPQTSQDAQSKTPLKVSSPVESRVLTVKAPDSSGSSMALREARQAGPSDRVEPDSALVVAPSKAHEAGSSQDWERLVESLGLSAMARELANNSSLVEFSDGVCRIALSPRLEHLKSPRAISVLEKSLQVHLARPLKLMVEAERGDSEETPALKRQKAEEMRKEQASMAIEDDPLITALKETFDARIVPGSIQSKES